MEKIPTRKEKRAPLFYNFPSYPRNPRSEGLNRVAISPWKFRWWENKAPYDLINGQPFAGRARRRIVRRAYDQFSVGDRPPTFPPRKTGTLSGRSSSGEVTRDWERRGGEGEGGEKRKAIGLSLHRLSLSLAPRLFINALIRGELLERWYPKREADTHPRVSMRPTH